MFKGDEIGLLLGSWEWQCWRKVCAWVCPTYAGSTPHCDKRLTCVPRVCVCVGVCVCVCVGGGQANPDADPKSVVMLASTVSSKVLSGMARKEGFLFEDTLTGYEHAAVPARALCPSLTGVAATVTSPRRGVAWRCLHQAQVARQPCRPAARHWQAGVVCVRGGDRVLYRRCGEGQGRRVSRRCLCRVLQDPACRGPHCSRGKHGTAQMVAYGCLVLRGISRCEWCGSCAQHLESLYARYGYFVSNNGYLYVLEREEPHHHGHD